MSADQPSDAGARREMERMVWAAAFAECFNEAWPFGGDGGKAVEAATDWADKVAAAYREHGPTR